MIKDKNLNIDYKKHYIYSKQCKEKVYEYVKKHYENDYDKKFEEVQLKFVEFLKDVPPIGGSKNFHNKGVAANMDCFFLMAYYTVCKYHISVKEIDEIEEELFLPTFARLAKLKFINANKEIIKKLIYKRFITVERESNKYGDYIMHLDKYEKEKPLHYYFSTCVVSEFASNHGIKEIMPAMCNPDFRAMEALHAKLIRSKTLAFSDICDYYIVGDEDEFVKLHPEYINGDGFKVNE